MQSAECIEKEAKTKTSVMSTASNLTNKGRISLGLNSDRLSNLQLHVVVAPFIAPQHNTLRVVRLHYFCQLAVKSATHLCVVEDVVMTFCLCLCRVEDQALFCRYRLAELQGCDCHTCTS